MNPLLSVARIGVLPRLLPKATALSKTSGSVRGERTTSTSFMSGTGLKKCSPTNRVGRFVVAAISVMESDDVLEAKIASFPQAASRAWKTSRFTAMFSVTTSMTRSHPASFARSVVPSRREQHLRLALRRDLALLDALGEEALDLARGPSSGAPSSISRTTTR